MNKEWRAGKSRIEWRLTRMCRSAHAPHCSPNPTGETPETNCPIASLALPVSTLRQVAWARVPERHLYKRRHLALELIVKKLPAAVHIAHVDALPRLVNLR